MGRYLRESVGGGGGLVTPGTGDTTMTLNSDNTGNGGVVTINNTSGLIMLNGDNDIALYSQSAGGGGGAVGLSTDPPGQVGAFLFSGSAQGAGAALATTVNQTGSLVATGANSIALVAQSAATLGNGDVTVNIINPSADVVSMIVGGSAQGAGVEILNGNDNTLNNAGIITTISGIDGYAVRASGGNETVNNNDLMIGSVDLGDGVNALNNATGALFDAGVTVNLGPDGTFTNAGLLSPGLYENVATMSLTGSFVQSSIGTTGVDLDLLSETADELTATGTANVSGTEIINVLNPGSAQTGSHDAVLVDAAQGITGHDGLSLQAIPSAVATYTLIYPDPDDVVLNYDINYSPAGMNRNEHAVGTGINEIETARISPAFVPIAAALFYQPTVAKLAAVYDGLSGEGVTAAEQTAFSADDQVISSIDAEINAEMLDVDADDGLPASAEPWSRATHFWQSSATFSSTRAGQASTGSASVQANGSLTVVGVDHWINHNVVIGAAVSAGTSSYSVPASATTGVVYTTNFAGYAAWAAEHAYVNAILDFGSYGDREHRSAAIPGTVLPSLSGTTIPAIDGFSENLMGRYASASTSGQIEAGWRVHGPVFNFTPFAALRVASLDIDPFTETQAGGSPSQIGLSYASRDVFSIPAFLGGQLDVSTPVGYTGRLRAWVRLAWMHDFAPYRTLSAAFIAAPGYNFTVLGATSPRELRTI